MGEPRGRSRRWSSIPIKDDDHGMLFGRLAGPRLCRRSARSLRSNDGVVAGLVGMMAACHVKPAPRSSPSACRILAAGASMSHDTSPPCDLAGFRVHDRHAPTANAPAMTGAGRS